MNNLMAPILDALIAIMLDTNSVEMRTDGVKARLDWIGARQDALITSLKTNISVAPAATTTAAVVGPPAAYPAIGTVWVGVTTD